jgi:putative adhesin
MNTHSLRIAFTRATLGMAAFASLASAPALHAEDWNKNYTVAGHAQMRVNTDDASVRVSSGDTKQIEIHVIYNGYQLDKNLHIESRQDGDKVELSIRTGTHWGISFGGRGRDVRVEVHMPKDGDLQVDTGDGSVEVTSLNGNVAVHTGDGSVKADALNGTIDLHTSDGSIAVDGLKGDMRLRTGDGSVQAHNIDGKVEADSGDGSIRLEGRFDSLSIKTGDGGIDAHVLPGSKIASNWSIRTGDGSVDLTLPSDFQANIEATTGDGHISLGIPVTVEGTFSNSQIHGKMNGGGQPLVIHTGDGSIRLSKS